MRLCKGLPSLRRRREHAALLEAFAAASGSEGFRLVHYSAQGNHLHLLCEARERRELSCGLQGLAIRMAKKLNRLWSRGGKVFADRYHDRILRSPLEVRRALAYVLNNWRKHGIAHRRDRPDPCSSGRWFAGWRGWAGAREAESPLARARTWLLSVGWLRHGRVRLDEIPAGRRAACTARARCGPESAVLTHSKSRSAGNRGGLDPLTRLSALTRSRASPASVPRPPR